MWDGCAVCGAEQELKILGDPYEQVPDSVWELGRVAALLDRGLPAQPEPGGWMDQPAAWCEAVEYVLAERSRMRREAEDRELKRLMS
jgi:hypothetical protein